VKRVTVAARKLSMKSALVSTKKVKGFDFPVWVLTDIKRRGVIIAKSKATKCYL
jgi:hypothetical protein